MDAYIDVSLHRCVPIGVSMYTLAWFLQSLSSARNEYSPAYPHPRKCPGAYQFPTNHALASVLCTYDYQSGCQYKPGWNFHSCVCERVIFIKYPSIMCSVHSKVFVQSVAHAITLNCTYYITNVLLMEFESITQRSSILLLLFIRGWYHLYNLTPNKKFELSHEIGIHLMLLS